MSPEINLGSLTITESFPSYQVGEIISYYSPIDGQEEVVTPDHRHRRQRLYHQGGRQSGERPGTGPAAPDYR